MHSGNTDGSVRQMHQFSSGRTITGDGRTGLDNERSWARTGGLANQYAFDHELNFQISNET